MKVIIPDRNQLNEVGVTLLSGNPLTLQCQVCEFVWKPLRHQSDFLRRDYWQCPRGCNLEPDFEPEPFYGSEPGPEEPALPIPNEVEGSEPETPEERLDREIAKLMKDYSFYANEAKRAKTEEAKQRFQAEAERTLDRWLAHLDKRETLEDESCPEN